MKKLIIINLSGNRYGVWKHEVLDIKKISSVHRLPLRQEHLAGVGLSEDGRTVTFFDLGVCMGHDAFDRSKPALALVVSGGERLEGFIVGCEMREAEAASGDVFPMPEYLNAPELDSCALIEGELMPVINIGVLYGSIGKKGWNRPCLRSPESAARRDPGSADRFRVFRLGGLPFALPGEPAGWEASAAGLGRVRPMPLAAKHIEGIVFKNGRVSAAVNPASHLGLADGNGQKVLFLEKSGGLGFIADSDMGVISGGALKPMPPLVFSAFMGHGLIHGGEVIPLVDIRALLSEKGEEASSRRYAPSLDFVSAFGKEGVSVLEFSLQGVRHSLPSSEVEEIVEFRPYRCLTGGWKIALGVLEHKGEILPVIDLALCFGRRTEAGAGSKMVLVKNGDFRAFLLTEGVSESRRTLPIEEQKRLPIEQRQNYVYGCYLDGTKVRLILNVEALATNFVKEEVGGYLSRIVEELEKGSKPQNPIPAPGRVSSEKAAGDEKRKAGKSIAPDGMGQTLQEPSASGLPVLSKTEVGIGSEPIERLKKAAEARGYEQKADEGKGLEIKVARGITPSGERRPSGGLSASSAPEGKPVEDNAFRATQKVSGQEGGYDSFLKRDTAHEGEAGEDPGPHGKAENKDVEERRDETESPRIEKKLSFGDSGSFFEPVYLEGELQDANRYLNKKIERKRRIWGVIIIVVTLAALYYTLWPGLEAWKPGSMKAAEVKEPERQKVNADKAVVFAEKARPADWKAEPHRVDAARAPQEEGSGLKASTAGDGKPEAQNQKGALLLEIAPAKKEISAQTVRSVPYGAEEYIVVRGDTLWRIAKRFTGDPFEYRKIAANSKIKDPDLIFPGQEIFIMIKKE